MTDLKPCPFCGGEAKLELGNYTFDGEKYNDVDIFVRCETCNIMQYQGMFCNCQKDELESCCDAWNTRAGRTCTNVSDDKEIDHFECSVCGNDFWLDDIYGDTPISHCVCGAKVVSE